MEGMQMNQSQQVKRTRNAVGAYVDGIQVPRYDEVAVRARMNVSPTPRATPRLAAAAPAACAVVVAFVLASPTVRAQVERMLRAMAEINGQAVPVAVSSVSLDQARREMPFAVIAPAAIPAGMSEQINELNPSSSRLDSRLFFQFSRGDQAAPLTIMESRAQNIDTGKMRLWMTTGTGAPPAEPRLPSGPGEHAFVKFRSDGRVTQQIKVEPITWIVRGTRVDLVSPPGLLSPVQLAAIRRAMSR